MAARAASANSRRIARRTLTAQVIVIENGNAPGAHAPDALPPPRTVLLVDDEEAIRKAITRWLSRRGWTVVTCANGQEALDILAVGDSEQRYDAILCDLRMPGVSGVTLYNYLRDNRPALHARLVLATGDVASGEIARFLSDVTCPVLEKPFDFVMLEHILEQVASSQ